MNLPLNYGTGDFREYWSAYELVRQGQNPYDPILMREAQRSINSAWTEPMMMWNPPWIFLLLAPILQFQFLVSAKIHFVMSIFAILISALIGNYCYKDNVLSSVASFISVSLIPIYYCLELGQMGCYLAFFSTLILLGLKNTETIENKSNYKNYFLELPLYFGILGCLIKPHLFLFLFASISIQKIYIKNYSFFFKLLLSFTILTALTEVLYPNQIINWLSAMKSPPDGVISPWGWYVPTLVGISRYVFEEKYDLPYQLFPIIIPLTSILLVFLNYNSKKSLLNSYSRILVTSYFVSPFGWIFDFCGSRIEKLNNSELILFLFTNTLFFIVVKEIINSHLVFIIYPFTILIFIWMRQKKKIF